MRIAATTGICLLPIAVMTASGCLLYTDPINMRPSVNIVAPAQVWHGQAAVFQATASDPNGDTVTLDWAHVPGRCADNNVFQAQRLRTQSYTVDATDAKLPFCVAVFATDSHDAAAAATLDVDPLDHTPVAVINVVRPDPVPVFPLYSKLEFSGSGSTDADPSDVLTYTWSLVSSPTNSVAALTTCPTDSGPAFTCLTADVPGDYQMRLVVNDGFPSVLVSTSTPALKTVTIAADAFPCLGVTTPELTTSMVDRDPLDPNDTFTVGTVIDDGDPYPDPSHTGEHFSWFLGHATDALSYVVGHDFPSYTVPPGEFALGELGRVRVEIRDSVNGGKIAAALLGCGDAAVCAAAPGSGCFQRMTWVVNFKL